METRDVWGQQLLRLEVCQLRHLRRIAKRPSHLFHDTNEDLREMLGIPSIEAWLSKLRLGMWVKIANNPIPEVMAACFGARGIGEHGRTGVRDEMVLSDMARLRDACARTNRDLPADAQKRRN